MPDTEVEVGAMGEVLQPPIVTKAATKAAIVVTSIDVLEIAGVALDRSRKGL